MLAAMFFSGCSMHELSWQSGHIDDQGRIHYSTLYRVEDPEIRIEDKYDATRTTNHQQQVSWKTEMYLDPGHPEQENVYVAYAYVALDSTKVITVYDDQDGKKNWDGTDYGRGFSFWASTGFVTSRGNALNNLAVGYYDLVGEVHWAKKACRDCESRVVAVARTKIFQLRLESGPDRDYDRYWKLHHLAIQPIASIAVYDCVSNGIQDISGTVWTMKQATEQYWLVPGIVPGYHLSAVTVKLGDRQVGAAKTHDGFYALKLSTNSSAKYKYRKSRNTIETLWVKFFWTSPGKNPIFKFAEADINGNIESFWEPRVP